MRKESIMKHMLMFVFVTCFAMFAIGAESENNKALEPAHQNLQIHLKMRSLMPFNYGPSLAVETSLSEYFSLGGVLNAMFFLFITGTHFDADIFAKAIYPFKMGENDAKIYLITPMGLTIFPGKSSPELGFNLAALPGFEYYLNKHWGVFLEAGYNMTFYTTGPGHRLELCLGATYVIN